MKPPFSYYGGKTRLAARIVEHLPPHEHYVEPYAGGLSVLLAKERSKMETVNDLDHDLMTFWRVLRDQPEELIRVCAATPNSREEFEVALDLNDLNDLGEIEHARRVWVRLSQGLKGSIKSGRKSWCNFIRNDHESSTRPRYLEAYVGRMNEVANRLYSVSLDCRPALEVIELYGKHPSVCLYVDPPYLGAEKVHANTETDHLDLAMVLHETKASVVLSGYTSPLYESLYGGWERAEFAAVSGRGVGRAKLTEVLWIKEAS